MICNAIASHGGKKQEDYLNLVSMCLVLADKLDFNKTRYKETDQTKKTASIYRAIEKVNLINNDNNLVLQIYTPHKEEFDNLKYDYFFK